MECWYGIMGVGAICHTLNVRLSDKDLRFIVGGWGGVGGTQAALRGRASSHALSAARLARPSWPSAYMSCAAPPAGGNHHALVALPVLADTWSGVRACLHAMHARSCSRQPPVVHVPTTHVPCRSGPVRAGDAADAVILADPTFVPLLERILPMCPSVRAVVLLTDR